MNILANISSECSSPALAQTLKILKNILTIIQIVGPILLIVFLALNITKLVVNPDDKKLIKKIINQILAIIILFMIPIIVNAFMLMLDDSFDISKCWNTKTTYTYNPYYIKTYEKNYNYILDDRSDYENGDERKNNESNNNNKNINNDSYSNNTNATNTGNFTKYNLTDSELKQITALALHEQGSPEGAAAEASLMANRFELYGSNYGSGAKGLISYVKNSGWFAHASRNMSDTKIVTNNAKNAVKSVLVEGKRTLPGYVDEHDCFSDISNISTGSVRNRSSYKQFKTKIHNRYGANYTFYSFPTKTSDPFGYTSESKRKKIGENYYSYNS